MTMTDKYTHIHRNIYAQINIYRDTITLKTPKHIQNRLKYI